MDDSPMLYVMVMESARDYGRVVARWGEILESSYTFGLATWHALIEKIKALWQILIGQPVMLVVVGVAAYHLPPSSKTKITY